MFQDYVERIDNSRVYAAAHETPLQAVSILSRRLENQVFLKREDLQPVFSFKLRGAYNKMAGLSANARKRGVIAASAGNHAQGIALAAKRLDMKPLIVMPQTTPQIKLESVRALGAAIELQGSNYDEAFEFAQHKAKELGSTFIHPYDDEDVIAGQGTIAMEILRRMPGQLDAIFVPVGGGGLIAGTAAYVKALRPEIRVVGGRATGLRDERLFRFDLPEQPGALLRYLTRMGKRWNISLFHYRSHGAAYGRVLAGIQVPDEELGQFHAFLSDLSYPFHEETGNSAYELFLGSDQ